MTDSWRIGHIGGVPMHLSRSWPIGAGLIVLIYYSSLDRAGLPAARSLLMAVVLAIALFLSVLVHEVSHGLAGTMLGRRPSSYTLTLWGGYTRFSKDHATPGASAVIAAAGPISNLLLALLLWGLLRVLPDAAFPYLMPLMYLNLALGLFNLAPGIPMDGGRVVEAGVWATTGSRERGTLVASWTGLALTVGIGVWAVVQLLGSDGFGSHLWLILIATFLGDGALRSLRHSRARLAVTDLDLRRIMTPVPVVGPEAPAGSLPREGAVVAGPDGGVRGVVTPEVIAGVGGDVTAESVMQVVPAGAVLRASVGSDAVAAAAMASRSSDVLVLLAEGGAWMSRVADLSQKLGAASRNGRARR